MSTGSSYSSPKSDPFVDELYFSALFDYEELFPISDEKYASELHLQEALISSSSHSKRNVEPENIVSEDESHQSFTNIVENMISVEKEKEKEAAEPSRRFCMICMDEKPSSDIFGGSNCTHSFCTICIERYVAMKIKENVPKIKCPDVNCTLELDPYTCQGIIPREVFDRWESALCESMLLASEKFYCPFKDCSAMMVEDGGNARVTVSECPCCHRLFCAQCKVAWHSGIGCDEFRKLDMCERSNEDLMVVELAKNKKWRRCPECRFYVEKVDGCKHISCRCGYQFCYGCGSQWDVLDHACSSI